MIKILFLFGILLSFIEANPNITFISHFNDILNLSENEMQPDLIFLTCDSTYQASKPIKIKNMIGILSNFSSVYFKGRYLRSIFIFDEKISFFLIKNLNFIFESDSYYSDIFLVTKEINEFQIDSLYIFNLNSFGCLMRIEIPLRNYLQSKPNLVVLKNITITNSKFSNYLMFNWSSSLKIQQNEHIGYLFNIINNRIENSKFLKDFIFCNFGYLSFFLQGLEIWLSTFSEGLIFLHSKIEKFTLILLNSSILYCSFLGKKSIINLQSYFAKEINLIMNLINFYQIKSATGLITIKLHFPISTICCNYYIALSKFQNITSQTPLLSIENTNLYISKSVFEEISPRNQIFGDNMIDLVNVNLEILSSRFKKIYYYDSAIFIKEKNKKHHIFILNSYFVDFFLKNSFLKMHSRLFMYLLMCRNNFSDIKTNRHYLKLEITDRSLLNFNANEIFSIISNNKFLNIIEMEFLCHFFLSEGRLVMNENYLYNIDLDYLEWAMLSSKMFSLFSIHSSYVEIHNLQIVYFSPVYSFIKINNFFLDFKNLSFLTRYGQMLLNMVSRQILHAIDSFLVYIDSNVSKGIMLDMVMNVNSYSIVENIEIYGVSSQKINVITCFFCIFEISNISFKNVYTDDKRAYLIYILITPNNKLGSIKNVIFQYSFMKENIIHCFLANIVIDNLYVYDYKTLSNENAKLFNVDTNKSVYLSDYLLEKYRTEIFFYLPFIYFFQSNVTLKNSLFLNIITFEHSIIKGEFSSIVIKDTIFQDLVCFLQSILFFYNSFSLSLINLQFKNNLDTFGSIRLLNELSELNHTNFIFKNIFIYLNESLLILFMGTQKDNLIFFRYYFFIKFITFLIINADISIYSLLISPNVLFNLMGFGYFYITDSYFEIIPKTSLATMQEVDKIFLKNNICLSKRLSSSSIAHLRKIVSYYELFILNKSLIEIHDPIKYFQIESSIFDSIFSEKGSVLYINYFSEESINESIFEIRNSKFLNNLVSKEGGVLYLKSNNIFFTIRNNTFLNNKAETNGGVIFSEAQGRLQNNTFLNNQARLSGGVIKWSLTEPIIYADNYFADNKAEHGEVIASDAYYLIYLDINRLHLNKELILQFYKNNKKSLNLPAIFEEDCQTFHMYSDFGNLNILNKTNIITDWNNEDKIIFGVYDIYFQLMSINNSYIFDITNMSPIEGLIKAKEYITEDYYGLVILEKMEFIFKRRNGLLNFFLEKTPIFPTPIRQKQGLASMTFAMLEKCFQNEDFTSQNNIKVINYVRCTLGEYFEDSTCKRCPDDYYNIDEFDANSTESSFSCKRKPLLAAYSFGAKIIPYHGFWIKGGKDIIYPCNYPEACRYDLIENEKKNSRVLYSVPFESECLLGFEGIFCGNCKENSDLYKEKACIQCKDLNENMFILIANLILLLFFYQFTIISAGRITIEAENKIETPLFKIFMNLIIVIQIIKRKIDKMDFENSMIVKTVSSYEYYKNYLNYLGTVSYPSQIITFQCLSNYLFRGGLFPYFKLFLVGSLPFLFYIISLLLFVFFIDKRLKRDLHYLIGKNISLIGVIQFLFIYELIKLFFDFLNCTDYYEDRVLKVYPNISCNDSSYLLIRYIFIMPLFVLFSLVIPGTSFIHVLKNNHKLLTNEMLKKFGFIYLGYRPKLFFWEFLIYVKKLIFITFDVLFESSPFSYYFYICLGLIQLIYHYELIIHKPYKKKVLFKMEKYSSLLTLVVLLYATIHAGNQRITQELSFNINDVFDFNCPQINLLDIMEILILIVLILYSLNFLKLILARYFSYLKIGLHLTMRKSTKNKTIENESGSSMKNTKFIEMHNKLVFRKKRNSNFLSSMIIHESLSQFISKNDKIKPHDKKKLINSIFCFENFTYYDKNITIENSKKLIESSMLNDKAFQNFLIKNVGFLKIIFGFIRCTKK